ncbi:MAG: hypothetical protein BWY69_00472 [Planctomycetes bacterium ADurb.Bin401]|nr:MAG: hypothetical protein BWY69_00472 [Planctomycetes bacterium ADurb.Bin401]
MITNKSQLDNFYNDLEANEKISHKQAFAIFDMLYHEAVLMGAFRPENIWDEFEADLRLAKAINSVGM